MKPETINVTRIFNATRMSKIMHITREELMAFPYLVELKEIFDLYHKGWNNTEKCCLKIQHLLAKCSGPLEIYKGPLEKIKSCMENSMI